MSDASQTPENRPGLAAGAGGLDRALAEDLEKLRVDGLLARQDAVDEMEATRGQLHAHPLYRQLLKRA